MKGHRRLTACSMWWKEQSKRDLFFLWFYLFISRGEGRKRERERNNNVYLPLMQPHCGPGPQLRHVSWLGIELVTFWFTGWHSMQWATPAKVQERFKSWRHVDFSFTFCVPDQLLPQDSLSSCECHKSTQQLATHPLYPGEDPISLGLLGSKSHH